MAPDELTILKRGPCGAIFAGIIYWMAKRTIAKHRAWTGHQHYCVDSASSGDDSFSLSTPLISSQDLAMRDAR